MTEHLIEIKVFPNEDGELVNGYKAWRWQIFGHLATVQEGSADDLSGALQSLSETLGHAPNGLVDEIANLKLRLHTAQKWLEKFQSALGEVETRRLLGDWPKVVCLCGSTRFSTVFDQVSLQETMAGNIVLSIGCHTSNDKALFDHLSTDEKQRVIDSFNTLHRRKIDMADEVLIINVGGYVGDQTRNELTYAVELGKSVR